MGLDARGLGCWRAVALSPELREHGSPGEGVSPSPAAPQLPTALAWQEQVAGQAPGLCPEARG